MKTWIPQPSKSKLCGQIAVAVIAEITVEESIKVVGKKGCTTTKQLAAAFRKLGYQCPNRCRPFKLPLPELAVAQMRHPARKSGWHWVAIANGKIYDGIFGDKDGNVRWPAGGKMTSFFPLTKS
jgi:hypothetical protein